MLPQMPLADFSQILRISGIKVKKEWLDLQFFSPKNLFSPFPADSSVADCIYKPGQVILMSFRDDIASVKKLKISVPMRTNPILVSDYHPTASIRDLKKACTPPPRTHTPARTLSLRRRSFARGSGEHWQCEAVLFCLRVLFGVRVRPSVAAFVSCRTPCGHGVSCRCWMPVAEMMVRSPTASIGCRWHFVVSMTAVAIIVCGRSL
eukprot:TRINITY_DN5179_c0_g1_i1.p1 TRINITY_DN5179_c0_g1~~TRINITY_DN5179_c0_g1_i1.p1  ORF type:complete len:206 (+),score=7.91 TRINITY_DN5179_c0_g1_i1:811-1428(+)